MRITLNFRRKDYALAIPVNQRHLFDKFDDKHLFFCDISSKEKRTTEQSKKMWAMLGDISKQVFWHGEELTTDDWKDFFTASLRGSRLILNMESNGFVQIGGRTSKMDKEEMGDLITLISAFGDQRGVEWSEPKESE